MYPPLYRSRLLVQYPRKALLPCLLLLTALSSGVGQVPEFRVFTYRGGLACSDAVIQHTMDLYGLGGLQ